MFFDSVEQILTLLEQQPGWAKFREHRQLLKCWHNVVSQKNLQHTRPLYVNRQVLWVATSSSARAQELSFQRYTLLKKLNKQLPFALKDIRFSASQWHQDQAHKNSQTDGTYSNIFSLSEKYRLLASSPESKARLSVTPASQAQIPQLNSENLNAPTSKAKAAAQRWLKNVEQNSALFFTCPECNAPTPEVEIKRWSSCYLCTAQKWSKAYRPSTFS